MNMTDEQLRGIAEYERALYEMADRWVPACGGVEVVENGYLYVYNPGRDEHGWLNVATDIVQEESPYE